MFRDAISLRALRIAFTVVLAALVMVPPLAAQDAFAVRNVRLFDGDRVHDRTTVLVRDGHIAAIGPRARIPAGVRSIDGTGMTLMPAMIDAHTHTFARDQLVTALGYGVVANLDMFTVPAMAAPLLAEQRDGRAHDRAELRSALILATAPGGHGTQFGATIPTISSPADASAFVQERIDQGSEWIKIVMEDGSTMGGRFSSIDSATMHAIVHEAHARGKLAVVHVSALRTARQAVRAGADGLVHLWIDSLPESELVSEMARRRVFVIPTLTILEGVSGSASGASLVVDTAFAALLASDARQNLGRAFPASARTRQFDIPLQSLSLLARAGVRILAGTDAPNPGTWYGASIHRELELLVKAGLTPLEALQSATSRTADAFRLEEFGRARPGAPAHLVLVRGNPLQEITHSRRIVRVWKNGRAMDRDALAEGVARQLLAERMGPVVPAGVAPGMVLSDFDSGAPATAFGSGWVETSDAIAGGSSSVSLRVVAGGAASTSHALEIRGEIAAGLPFAWSGAIFFPTEQPMAPANLAATSGIRFQARGDEGTYRVFVFTRRGGQIPGMREFAASDQWGEVSVRWSDVGSDGADVGGIAIVGGPRPGPFRLLVDQVVFD